MGDPVTLALGAQAGSSIFGGLAGSAEAKGENDTKHGLLLARRENATHVL